MNFHLLNFLPIVNFFKLIQDSTDELNLKTVIEIINEDPVLDWKKIIDENGIIVQQKTV